MGKKEKLVLAGTALATAVTSIFGGGSERANATEHINPPRPPADHQLNNFENPDPSQVEFPATQAKNSQAQTSPSLPRLEQEQQVEVVHIADLNEVVLSDEDFQALLPLWQEAFPDSDLMTELEQGGVSELSVSFTSKSLDSLPANVSERVLKIRTRLNDIISQSASESEIQDIFELNLAFYLKNNEVRLIVSARNTINLADELNAGSIVFIDSIGNLRYIEPAEGEQAGFLKADKQTADEASQGYGTMPDGLPAQFIVPEGSVVLATFIDDEGQERVEVLALLVKGTALVFPDEEQAGQNIARITTPAPNQRAPGHAREVVAPEEEVLIIGALNEVETAELQQVLKMYPGGNETMFANFIRENGWTATWDKERKAFEVNTGTETYYFFPRLGIEGAKNTDDRFKEDLDDGLADFGGSIVSSNFVPGSSGMKINVYVSRNFQIDGKEKGLRFREDLAGNQGNIDLTADLLIQEFPELLGKELTILLAADNFDIYGNSPDAIKEALELNGNYSFSFVNNDVRIGTDLLGEYTYFTRVSLDADKSFYEDPHALGNVVFAMSLAPFASNGRLDANDFNTTGERIKKFQLAYYNKTGLPSYTLQAIDD